MTKSKGTSFPANSMLGIKNLTKGADAMPSDERKENEDKRDQWERPVFRRLMANDAKGGNSILDDGGCNGTGSTSHHSSCF
jgi:hypothetical protein